MAVIPNPICWLGAIRNSLRAMAFVAGCDMRETERLNNCIVTVIRCERCGKHVVMWEPTARSAREPYFGRTGEGAE